MERQRVPQKVNCSSGFKEGATEGPCEDEEKREGLSAETGMENRGERGAGGASRFGNERENFFTIPSAAARYVVIKKYFFLLLR